MTVIKTQNATKDVMTLLSSDAKASDDRRKLVQLKDMLEKMLMMDPEKRAAPKVLLEHPFITEKLQS